MAKRKKPTRSKSDEMQAEKAQASTEVDARPADAEAPSAEQEGLGETAATAESGVTAPAEADVWAEDRVGPTEEGRAQAEESGGDSAVWAESADSVDSLEGAQAPDDGPAPEAGEGDEDAPVVRDASHMESIIESLLFASDRVLGLADLKRLLGERDGEKVMAAVESLLERRKGSGIEVMRLAKGWHLRTNPEHARWVSKLLAGRPMRLSRAMMETLAVVAYRQPVTRPEIDDIRGVDCGPVLKTLLDRGLIRIIGKKEEVGRPLLYGTTIEFLRVFNLRELTDLPTLREYTELSSEGQALVDAEHGPASGDGSGQGEGRQADAQTPAGSSSSLSFVPRAELPDEPEENDPLLDELDSANRAASKVLGAAKEPAAEDASEPEGESPGVPPTDPTRDS